MEIQRRALRTAPKVRLRGTPFQAAIANRRHISLSYLLLNTLGIFLNRQIQNCWFSVKDTLGRFR
jgi:hypothetical protein